MNNDLEFWYFNVTQTTFCGTQSINIKYQFSGAYLVGRHAREIPLFKKVTFCIWHNHSIWLQN